MSTRSLMIVTLNKETKVAQQCHFDGYPECRGVEIIEFINSILKSNELEKFKSNISKCSFYTDAEIDLLYMKYESNINSKKDQEYHVLFGDLCVDLLKLILNSNHGLKLKNSESFVADSLFCEWAYIIDLDKNEFSIFKGFNTHPLKENDYFYSFMNQNEKHLDYYPCKLVYTYKFKDLPKSIEEQLMSKIIPIINKENN